MYDGVFISGPDSLRSMEPHPPFFQKIIIFIDMNLQEEITRISHLIIEIGDEMGTKVINDLTNLGHKILYRGGDGDFIDMKFSVDLIIKTPSGVIKTIQVKTSEW
jgi:hypothetical protein